jgi:hypothetical protein
MMADLSGRYFIHDEIIYLALPFDDTAFLRERIGIRQHCSGSNRINGAVIDFAAGAIKIQR